MEKKIDQHFGCQNNSKLLRAFLFASALLLFIILNGLITKAENRTGNLFSLSAYQQWILDKTVDNVAFYHMLSVCNGKTVVLLKIVNRNKGPVTIRWKETFETQVDKDIAGYKGEKKISLKAGETLQGDCLSESNVREVIVLPDDVSPAYEAKISGFSFKEIVVSK